MYILASVAIIATILSVIVSLAGITLAKKTELQAQKSRPFECGFSPRSKARLPFSVRFFMVGIIFVIFDVELVLIFPAVAGIEIISGPALFSGAVVILLLGLLVEVDDGGLEWAA